MLQAVEVPNSASTLDVHSNKFLEQDSEQWIQQSGTQKKRNDNEEANNLAQYVDRQILIENRLHQLEDQLDKNSTGANNEVWQSFRAIIEDVRNCLQRCELLIQLPEIRCYVKRFQRSLELNAILHERWLGPDLNRNFPQNWETNSDAGIVKSQSCSDFGEGRIFHRSEHAHSVSDFTTTMRVKQDVTRCVAGKKVDGKKKPFRTVVDWCRPHTPLTVDPVFKGYTPPSGTRSQSRGEVRRRLPHLGCD